MCITVIVESSGFRSSSALILMSGIAFLWHLFYRRTRSPASISAKSGVENCPQYHLVQHHFKNLVDPRSCLYGLLSGHVLAIIILERHGYGVVGTERIVRMFEFAHRYLFVFDNEH